MDAKDVRAASLGKGGFKSLPVFRKRLKNIGNFHLRMGLFKLIQDGTDDRLGLPKTPPGERFGFGLLKEPQTEIHSHREKTNNDQHGQDLYYHA
jgi:hypothetical protein